MIYLDNAATTWPKPDSVIYAVSDAMKHIGANPGRSGHKMAIKANEKIYECREIISEFFGVGNPSNVIFTLNATHALNYVIHGVLNDGDHVICTSMDHNSVLRPVFSGSKKIECSIAYADSDGYIDINSVSSLIRSNTKLVIMTHVSNVCGTVMPIEAVAQICHQNNILFLLDASQSAGILNINMQKTGIDFLAAPGHKSLYGPMGTGILCINSSHMINPLIMGGTGSYSDLLYQPDELPDRLESGTLNLPGICGLCEGIKHINRIGVDNVYKHEIGLTSYLFNQISDMKQYTIIGNRTIKGRTGVISLVHENKDSAEMADILSKDYSIAVRAMYHCAYKSHQTLGTQENGTVRVSFGIFNTLSDVKKLIYALEHI